MSETQAENSEKHLPTQSSIAADGICASHFNMQKSATMMENF